MMKYIRFLLWAVLLGAGFLAGTAWQTHSQSNSSRPPGAGEENAPRPIQVQSNIEEPPSMPPGLTEQEKATIHLFENAAPSVAYITTSTLQRDFWTRNVMEIPSGSGSGFVWDKKGHIITNYHVIKDASRAQVTLADQSTWDATLVGGAPEKDLAVLKIEAPASVLKPIPVGSSDHLMVGQSVFAIGNPFGLDQSLTTGIISALGREINGSDGTPIRDVIQTDAAINPGNSGGPLLNSSGSLIGVNAAIYSPSGASAGIGFSIPADVVKWVVPDLIQYGKINRPSLGVEFASQQWMKRYGLEGALIVSVEKGSSAEKAGLRPTYRNRNGRIALGDIIKGIDGNRVEAVSDMKLILEKYKAGDVVKVRFLREDKELEVAVKLEAPE
ncbi:MAG: trypsin-like serine protease [Saprospiraceae bacterium]|nr:MAG: trypsin-like serine protease [Saprospiraceae bacterium]